MSTIVPYYRTVKQLLNGQSFSIDEYQREYKWEREHITVLLTDLRDKFLNCYQTGDETRKVSEYEDYFLGSIIVSKRNNKSFLVDGQQRITSLTLLLIYLYQTAKSMHLDIAGELAPLIYSDNYGEPSFNLDIPERLPVIEALFKAQPFNVDGKEESIRTMFDRYQNIEQVDLIGELNDALPHFIYWLMNKVGLIEIATDNDNYAFAIFETMNDRGKPLSPVDMLKAYLLAPVSDEIKRRNANQIWKKQVLDLISWGGELSQERDASCIQAWFRSQYADTIRERKADSCDKDWELIKNFHRWVRDNRDRLSVGDQSENLRLMTNDFPFFANAYKLILTYSKIYSKGWEAIYFNAHNEFTWQNTVLLAPLMTSDDVETVRRKMVLTASYLDIWLMRRVVNYIRVGYSSTSYAMWLLCKDIRRKTIDELVEILKRKLDNDDVTFDGCLAKGRGGIDALILNQFSRRYVFHLLARITAHIEKGAGRSDLFNKYVDREVKNSFDIEHIWADDFSRHSSEFGFNQEFQEWRNHVASLLLLPADVNRSLQAKSYTEKSIKYGSENFYAASLTDNAYKNQPQFEIFRTTNNLPFQSHILFGKKDQLERRKLVAALVNLVWSPERINIAAV